MFTAPPREKKWISWLYVGIWSIFIYATVPLARSIQLFVSDQWGRQTFEYVVLAVIIIAFGISVRYLKRHPLETPWRYVWLFGVSAVFVGYTIHLRALPEEALHFVEYGVLGLLAYRALTHRIRDVGIFIAAALIGAIVGTLDEALQWVIPRRYWGLHDIWLNFFAAALVQVGIAMGIRPPLISGKPRGVSVRWICRLGVVQALLLGCSLLNTPLRIASYADHVPFFDLLGRSDTIMTEYGHRYDDPEIGTFFSRLPAEELRRQDDKRAEDAAKALNKHKGQNAYWRFLREFSPFTDPFIHEAGVHLFRRDRYMHLALINRKDPKALQENATIAHRENRIMEKYFPNTLAQSNHALPPDKLKLLEANGRSGYHYISKVSEHLITSVSERQILWGMILIIMILIGIDALAGGRRRTRETGKGH